PVVYQQVGGSRRTIDGRYRVSDGSDGRHRVKFEVAAYDRTTPLVIDPVLALGYSTYLGDGLTSEILLTTTVEDPYPVSIAVDAHGNAYVAGNTHDANFPTKNPYQPSVNETDSANGDAFVAKFSADGSSLVYSTYLGGSFQDN